MSSGSPIQRIRRLFVGGTSDVRVQLLRYFFVGGFAWLVDFGLLAGLTELAGMHYLWSAAVGFMAGLVINYVISVWWVFDSRRLSSPLAEFGLFAFIGVAGLGWNELLLWLLVAFGGVHYLLSKVAATAFVFGWNFVVRKVVLFR